MSLLSHSVRPPSQCRFLVASDFGLFCPGERFSLKVFHHSWRRAPSAQSFGSSLMPAVSHIPVWTQSTRNRGTLHGSLLPWGTNQSKCHHFHLFVNWSYIWLFKQPPEPFMPFKKSIPFSLFLVKYFCMERRQDYTHTHKHTHRSHLIDIYLTWIIFLINLSGCLLT